ncbi:MAG: YfhO family protein [Deltaproteobacteria bacterium]|nr:YfhO family protein [Deltaproteobacteria bacterium]
MLGGYLFSVHNLLSTLLSVTWVPFVIFFYLKAIKSNSLKYTLLTGITLAVMFTGGGVEVLYGTLGLLLFLTLLPETFLSLSPENTFPPPRPNPLPQGEREPKVISPPLTGGDEGEGDRFSESEDSSKNCAYLTKRIAYLFLSIIIFFLLSAVQLLPFLELSYHSIRATGLSYFEATTWSMDLKDLIQFFIPDPYGYGTSETKYWSNQSWLKTIYTGTIPFILSVFFFIEKGRRTLPFLLFLLFSFVLAFGKNTGIYEYLYYYLPFFNKIRYPVKFLFLVFILFSICAGLGWDSLKQSLEQKRKSGKRIIFGLLCLATIAAIAFGFLSYFDNEVKDFLIKKGIKYPEYNDVKVNVFNTKRLLVIFILSALMLYGSLRSIKMQRILPYLLVSILTIDLFFAHIGYYFSVKSEEYHKSSKSMNFILKDNKELFRVFLTPKTKNDSKIVISLDNTEDISSVNMGKEIIQGYNIERRIFDIEGFEVVRLLDYEKLFVFLTTVPAIDSTNLLALLNVKYVLSIPDIESDEFKTVKTIAKLLKPEGNKDGKKPEGENFLRIYQNLNYLPRAFLVEKNRVITKEEEYKKVMQSKDFKPSEEALLYEEPWEKKIGVGGQGAGVENSKLKVQNSRPDKKSEDKTDKNEVKILNYRNNSMKLNVNTDKPKILVISETYYPGWKAYVDGKETKILKANFVFRAVPLSAGKHTVEFIYDPWTFKIGLYITLATIILLLSFGIFAFFSRSQAPAWKRGEFQL